VRVPPWAKSFGLALGDTAADGLVVPTSTGGTVVGGVVYLSIATGDHDAWLVRLDGSGNPAWQKRFGGAAVDAIYCVSDAPTGFIAGGATWSFGAGGADLWLLRVDENGALSWQKTYGGAGDDYVARVRRTSDGGFILAGGTTSFGAGLYDAWVLKLDGAGAVAWQKVYGGAYDDFFQDIVPTADGGYIAAGIHRWSSVSGGPDFWVVKLNSDGTIAWQNRYPTTGYEQLNAVAQTPDGGYVAAGMTDASGAGFYDTWVLRLSAGGATVWQKTYGGAQWDEARSLGLTSDGGFIVAGYTQSFGAGRADAWALRLTGDGSVAWQKTFGGAENEELNWIAQAPDGDFIALGQTASFGASSYDLWLMKIGGDGSLSPLGAATSVIPADSTFSAVTPLITVADTAVAGVDTSVTGIDTAATFLQQAP
jgi:uncharacterized delta-60 repeat protein